MHKGTTLPAYARMLLAACMIISMLSPVNAAGKTHHLMIQVDANDAAVMNLALNNIANVTTYYEAIGETIEIELVAYGPGLHMLRADTSPVAARIKSLKESLPNLTFSACNVTKKGMEKAEGKEMTLLPQARLVPAGVVRLVELQELGWSYIKP